VILPPGNVGSTWLNLPKTLTLHAFTPESAGFTRLYLPKTLGVTSFDLPKTLVVVLRGFTTPVTLVYVILHPADDALRESSSRNRCFTWCYPPKTMNPRDFASRKRMFYVFYLPKALVFTRFHLPETIVPREFASRKRLFYVILPPESARFTGFCPPKALVLRDVASRKRWFHVILPPERARFT
jgi:hypothetical protein